MHFIFTVTLCCCSVAQLSPTLCDPMGCSTPGFPVLHHLLELAQTHAHSASDAIQSCPQSFPASGSFPKSQLFTSGGQSIGASASASILLMNIQDWFLLGLTGWISLRVLQHHSSKASILLHSAFLIVGLSHSYMTTGKTVALTKQTYVGKVMSLLFNMLSRFIIDFLFRSKRLNFMATVTICSHFRAQENKACYCFHCFPIYLPWRDETRCHDLSFVNVEF